MASSSLPDFKRFRPLRADTDQRERNAETRLTGSEFVYPMFVINGEGECDPVPSMPGIARVTADEAMREMDRALSIGVDRFLFFGIPDEKDAMGSRGLVSRRSRFRERWPN